MGLGRVAVFLDPNLESVSAPQNVLSEIQKAGLETLLFSRIQVEPSLDSLE